ncbi:coadhesin-like [Mytilus galloprovincialis]|uniref:coadhesin-like n=1 Tax=Mytilus galloprovincialis TaxID=29158 RepID=UPI003F7CCF43
MVKTTVTPHICFINLNGSCSKWTCWSHCSVTCGSGSQERSRTCQNPPSARIGPDCSKSTSESKTCTLTACPINGNYGEWTTWSFCYGTCKGGVQVRRRSCDSPPPANNGLDCSGKSLEKRRCKPLGCPKAGNWGRWTYWSECSVSCGIGSRERSRSCDNPAPAHGGPDCSGSGTDSEQCASKSCPKAGNWGRWTRWSSCSVSCGGGSRKRTRSCDNPAPANGGPDCSGYSTDSKKCARNPCPKAGNWGRWTRWSSCSVSCGTGSRKRTRSCDNPAPSNGGQDCSGYGTDSKKCARNPCPKAGNWGRWTRWSSCSVSCGGGSRKRTRSCDNPAPSNGGPDCSGYGTDSKKCARNPCPIDGEWGDWMAWSTCSGSCSNGHQRRKRICNNPKPANNGRDCGGTDSKIRQCKPSRCKPYPIKVNGSCSKWTCWTHCSVTCGSGSRERQRTCQNPPLAKIGPDCSKPTSESKRCILHDCPIAGKWGGWREWSSCSVSCGGGHQQRTRSCDNPAPANNGPDCSGPASQGRQCGKKPCPIAGKWGGWREWSRCSVSCGGGHQQRTRSCDNPAPANNGPDCSGPASQGRQCGKKPCPIAGKWGSWKDWSMCSVSCGGGHQTRVRSCDNPAPANNGPDCSGPGLQGRQCGKKPCPIAGMWGSWTKWTICPVTCGGGIQVRTRSCDSPSPDNDGPDCIGSSTESKQCAASVCPINGHWGEWGGWSSCSGTCGSGMRTRTRRCNNPAPANNGFTCNGKRIDTESCEPSGCS